MFNSVDLKKGDLKSLSPLLDPRPPFNPELITFKAEGVIRSQLAYPTEPRYPHLSP